MDETTYSENTYERLVINNGRVASNNILEMSWTRTNEQVQLENKLYGLIKRLQTHTQSTDNGVGGGDGSFQVFIKIIKK